MKHNPKEVSKLTEVDAQSSMNVILGKILSVLENILTTEQAALGSLGEILTASKASLILTEQGNDILQQIAKGMSGEHTYTVKVQQVDSTKKK